MKRLEISAILLLNQQHRRRPIWNLNSSFGKPPFLFMLAFISLPNCGAFMCNLERNAVPSNAKVSDGFNGSPNNKKQPEIGSGCFSVFFHYRFKNKRVPYFSLPSSSSSQDSPLIVPAGRRAPLAIYRSSVHALADAWPKLSLSFVHPPSHSLTRPHSLHRQLAPHLPLAHRQPSGLAGPAGSYHPSLPPACRSSHR